MAEPPTNLCEGGLFVYALRRVTEAAARAASHWIGRGEQGEGDRAAVAAMCAALARLPLSGRVVVGEGESAAGCLTTGTVLGAPGPGRRAFDVAADPVEGMSYLARGMTNAMAAIALAPAGRLFDPGPAFYMEKLVTPPAAHATVDPAAPVEARLAALARAVGKPVSELTVFVLEKPRHRDLVARIHRAGARVLQYPAGDIAGSVMAAIPDSGIDALMGTGGTREGLIAACAIRALGGAFHARLDPQLATERQAVAAAGLDTRTWRPVEDLVRADEVYFCATGITTGLLFEGVERHGGRERTQSLLVAGPAGERQILTTFHHAEPAAHHAEPAAHHAEPAAVAGRV